MNVEPKFIKKTKVAKGSAPGQYLGYGLQPVRLFYHLLNSPPDAQVGLEYFDDVSTHNSDGTCVLEQCKSALSQNPISNWSVELWKTMANWIANIDTGLINPELTVFRMYVVPAKQGTFAQTMHEAQSAADITKIVSDIKKKRVGLTKSPKCEPFLQAFFEAKDSVITSLIRNFELVASDENPIDPIRNFLDATVRPNLAEEAIKWGIGYAKLEVEGKIREKVAPLLLVSSFRTKFRAFIAKHDNASVLHSLTETPSDAMVEELIAKAPVFLRQLDLVEAGRDLKTRASSDFLRSSSDKTQWAEAGYVFEDSLIEYDDGLKIRHLNLRTEVEISGKNLNASDLGRLLYSKCCQGPADSLEGRIVPSHFLSGSLNSLADRMEIGWHPEFKASIEDGE